MDNSMTSGDTLVYSEGESSIGDTKSILPLYDGRLGGYSNDEPAPVDHESLHQTTIYMAGTAMTLNYTAARTMGGTGTSMTYQSASGLVKPPTEVLSLLCCLIENTHRVATNSRELGGVQCRDS